MIDIIKKYVKQLFLLMVVLISIAGTKAQTAAEINILRQQLSDGKETTTRVELLLQLGEYYVKKAGQRRITLDSATLLKNEAAALSKKLEYSLGAAECMVLEAMINSAKKNNELAYRLLNTELLFFEKNKLINQQAKVYTTLAEVTGIEENSGYKKIGYLEKALVLYKQTDSKKSAGYVLQELGNMKQMQGQLDTSLLLLDQALQCYQSVGYKELQVLYAIYAHVYYLKGSFSKALHYGLTAVKTAEDLNDYSIHLCNSYMQLGMIYNEIENKPLAISWFEKSRQIAISLNDTTRICQATMNIASMLIATNKSKQAITIMIETEKRFPPSYLSFKVGITALFIQAYTEIKEFKNAAVYFERMKSYYHLLNKSSPAMNYVYIGILTYLQTTNQYEKTYEYIQGFSDMSIQTGNLKYRAEAEKAYFEADSATGKFISSIKHYQKYKMYFDSVINTDNEKQLNSLQLQFETAQKDKNIKLLTQKNQLQDAVIKKDKITKRLIIGGSVLLFLLLVLSYSRYRLKQRSNARLQSKQDEINHQNELLKKVLHEKEWLLREIHHRVKNNLQVVISLLNTQSAYLQNEDALQAIQNSQHRMYAMSLIHQKLYQSDNLSSIDMSWYIKEMVTYMQDCFDTGARIRFVLETDIVNIDIAQAVPLGLILNEAITNSIKYAFPGNRQGEVKIALKEAERNTCTLIISDDGIGLPDNFNLSELNSLGMSLMHGLSEQLGGTLTFVSDKGTRISITFQLNTQFANTHVV